MNTFVSLSCVGRRISVKTRALNAIKILENLSTAGNICKCDFFVVESCIKKS